MQNKGNIFIVSAASGTGKSSLINQLIQEVDDIFMSISYTTRNPRKSEQDTKDYNFISKIRFEQLQLDNYFVESANVFGNLYGTSFSSLNNSINKGFDVILELDWQGKNQIKNYYKDAVTIFIIPPNIETLEKRLKTRAQDQEKTIKKRMQEAKNQISHAFEYDYVIENYKFQDALSCLKSIVKAIRQKQENSKDKIQMLINR